MKYIKLASKELTNIYDIRKSHPNMSIPDGADLSDLGYAPVLDIGFPTPEVGFMFIEGPLEQRDGKWYTTHVKQAVPAQPKYVPYLVTMGQARLALFDLGKLDQVTLVINALPEAEKQRALIEWEYRPNVERNSPLVEKLGTALNINLDELFIAASKL